MTIEGTLENDQSVDRSAIRRLIRRQMGTPSKSKMRRKTYALPAQFTLADADSSGWGREASEIVYSYYLRACRDLSNDRPTCQRAREQWDSEIVDDMEQRSNEILFDAVDGVKDEISDELSGILRDIRDEAQDIAETLMWRAVHQR